MQFEQAIPHADVLNKINETSKTFRILFINTTATIPYTSVYMQVDCGYMSDEVAQRVKAAAEAEINPQPK